MHNITFAILTSFMRALSGNHYNHNVLQNAPLPSPAASLTLPRSLGICLL